MAGGAALFARVSDAETYYKCTDDHRSPGWQFLRAHGQERQVDARRVTAGAMHDDSEYSLCIPVVLHSSSTRVPCYRSTSTGTVPYILLAVPVRSTSGTLIVPEY